MIISRSIIFNEDDFSCLGDKTREKIVDNEFIIIEINLDKQNVDDQT